MDGERHASASRRGEGSMAETEDYSNLIDMLFENIVDKPKGSAPTSGSSSVRSSSPTNEGADGQQCASDPANIVQRLQPDVPSNTPMDEQAGDLMSQKGHQELPSFNNTEMLQKIRDKKSLYDGCDDEISKEASNYPYTPANSYTDFGRIGQQDRTCPLPNFMNDDMLQRIEEKKATLESMDHSDTEDFPGACDANEMGTATETSDHGMTRTHLEEAATFRNNDSSAGDLTESEQLQSSEDSKHLDYKVEGSTDSDPDQQAGAADTKHGSKIDFSHTDLSLTGPQKLVKASQGKAISFVISQSGDDKVEETLFSDHTQSNQVQFSTSTSDSESCHDRRADMSAEHISETTLPESTDFSYKGITIQAENEQEAAYKFTESIIRTAAEKYRQQFKDGMDKPTFVDSLEDRLHPLQGSISETEKKPTEEGSNNLCLDEETTVCLPTKSEPSESDLLTSREPVINTPESNSESKVGSDSCSRIVLGEETGESSTECGTFEEYMISRDMIASDIGIDQSIGHKTIESRNLSNSSRMKSSIVEESEQVKHFVEDVIKQAVDIYRKNPEGSTAELQNSRQKSPDGSNCTYDEREPVGGSTSEQKASEAKAEEEMKIEENQPKEQKHQSHLESVSKTLGIDLDTSDEPNKFRDPLTEDLTLPENVPAERPTSLNTTKKKIVPNLDLLSDDDLDIPVSPISTDDDIGISIDDEKTPDDLTTPDVLNNSMFDGELEWQSVSSSTPVEPIPEYTAREEFEDERHWRSVQIGEKWYKIDTKVIEPYKKVLSHGGYYGDGFNAIIVFTACYLPDRRRRDYHYVMDNLFLYVISTLELLVVEDYIIVYFHGATPRHKMPSLRWLKRCYDMIDRRLRKNLKGLLIVHPTIWLKTLVFMMKPFISSKFSSKLRYIKNLEALTKAVPTEYIYIPDEVKKYDEYGNKSSSNTSTGST